MKVSVVYPFLGTSFVRRFVVTCVETGGTLSAFNGHCI